MRLSLITLAAVGIILSTITLAIHLSSYVPPQIQTAHWDSAFVNHSPYSSWGHVPVAVFGIAGYSLIALLAFYRQQALATIFALCGLGYTLYLTDIEAHKLGVWCIYCVGSLMVMVLICFLAVGQLLVTPAESRR